MHSYLYLDKCMMMMMMIRVMMMVRVIVMMGGSGYMCRHTRAIDKCHISSICLSETVWRLGWAS